MFSDFATVLAEFFEQQLLFILQFVFGGEVILVFANLTNKC